MSATQTPPRTDVENDDIDEYYEYYEDEDYDYDYAYADEGTAKGDLKYYWPNEDTADGGKYWPDVNNFETYEEYSDYIDCGEELEDSREMCSRGM